jgi:hypothetical protein
MIGVPVAGNGIPGNSQYYSTIPGISSGAGGYPVGTPSGFFNGQSSNLASPHAAFGFPAASMPGSGPQFPTAMTVFRAAFREVNSGTFGVHRSNGGGHGIHGRSGADTAEPFNSAQGVEEAAFSVAMPNLVEMFGLTPGTSPAILPAPTAPTASTIAHTNSGLEIIQGIPQNAILYKAPDGKWFDAPPHANFEAELFAGQANGMYNLLGINCNIGQFGTYDFQREDLGIFGQLRYPAYVNASNYGVGVFMYGAGFSLAQTIEIGTIYAWVNSSYAGSPDQAIWWANGWIAAQSGQIHYNGPWL